MMRNLAAGKVALADFAVQKIWNPLHVVDFGFIEAKAPHSHSICNAVQSLRIYGGVDSSYFLRTCDTFLPFTFYFMSRASG